MLGQRKDNAQERGAITVLFAVMIIPLMLYFSIAFDGFLVMASDLQQDNNADYSALAALKRFRDLDGLAIEYRKSQAAARAEEIAGKNFYIGAPGTKQVESNEITTGSAGVLLFGNYDRGSRIFTEGPDASNKYNAVKLTLVTRPRGAVQVFFAGIMGVKKVNLRSNVIAFYDQELLAAGRHPYILLH
jgi:Flp pilus assembly protein TadG